MNYFKLSVFTLIIISVSSCYQNLEPDNILLAGSIDERVIEDQEETKEISPEEKLDQSQPADDSAIFSSLLADMFKAITLTQSLEMFNQDVAQVRSSNCPLTYLVSDGIYPDTFYVDFDNCDPSAVFNQKYDGALVFIINGELDNKEICPLFTVQSGAGNDEFFIAPGPTADHNKYIQIENKISFCLTDINDQDLSYNYELLDNIYINNSTNDASTKYPNGMSGGITIKSIGNDNLGDAATLIDNTFFVSAEPTTIECVHSNGDIESFCIATNPKGLKFRLICGCPETGQLYILNNSDLCDEVISNGSFLDFSYVEPGTNSCENTAINSNNEVVIIPCGQSF